VSGLDILAQRFLFGLVFTDPPFDDVADGNQADNPAVLDHRQMPEFARRHHFHDRTDSVGLLAADDLARHDRADRLVEHRSPAFAEHAHDVTLRQDAFDMALAHHQHGADLPLRQNLDRRRKLCVRLDVLDVMAFGIENCTYRHCHLPEPIALLTERDLYSLESSINSSAPVSLQAHPASKHGYLSTSTGLCLAS
jgi:hypothetical protein